MKSRMKRLLEYKHEKSSDVFEGPDVLLRWIDDMHVPRVKPHKVSHTGEKRVF